MTAFALYRLPHEDHATLIRQTEGEPAEFLSCAELNDRRGFVVAPFQISEKQPILLIRPDSAESIEVSGKGQEVREYSAADISLTSHLFLRHRLCQFPFATGLRRLPKDCAGALCRRNIA